MKRQISARTVDDLLRKTYRRIEKHGHEIAPTSGTAHEIFGVLLELRNPRARISRSQGRRRIFSALGEFCWYMAGSESLEFISYYLPEYANFAECADDGTVLGAYGPRLFNPDGSTQFDDVIAQLSENSDTRNAIIQVHDPLAVGKPTCTLSLQCAVRDGKLSMMTFMRSNDAYIGLPHDIFAFSMFQELIARATDNELGTYLHAVGSLHLYSNTKEVAARYLSEGWQQVHDGMPSMPAGDPRPSLRALLTLEEKFRLDPLGDLDSSVLPVEAYWRDLSLLLHAHRLSKRKDFDRLLDLAEMLDSDLYKSFLKERAAEGFSKGHVYEA